MFFNWRLSLAALLLVVCSANCWGCILGITPNEEFPVAGVWGEKEHTFCGQTSSVSDNSIGELDLYNDGKFKVTWTPFETYHDYAGTYKISGASIEFADMQGNYVPENTDLSGTFQLEKINGDSTTNEGNRLILVDLWFGAKDTGEDAGSPLQEGKICRYVFE